MKAIILILIESIFLIAILYNLIVQFYKAKRNSKNYNANRTLLFSILSIIVGFLMWIINGLTVDYGTEEEKVTYYSGVFCTSGFILMMIGLITLIALIIIRVSNWLKKITH